MILSLNKKEVGLAFVAMSRTGQFNNMGQEVTRQFSPLKQEDVSAVFKALRPLLNESGDGTQISFSEGEVELNAPAAALVLECLNRDWPMEFSEAYVSLKSKLTQ